MATIYYYFDDIQVSYPQLHEKASYEPPAGSRSSRGVPQFSINMILTQEQVHDFYMFIVEHLDAIDPSGEYSEWVDAKGDYTTQAAFTHFTKNYLNLKKYLHDEGSSENLFSIRATSQFDILCGYRDELGAKNGEEFGIVTYDTDQIKSAFYAGCRSSVKAVIKWAPNIPPKDSPSKLKIIKPYLNAVVKIADGIRVDEPGGSEGGKPKLSFGSGYSFSKRRPNLAKPAVTQPAVTQSAVTKGIAETPKTESPTISSENSFENLL